MRKLVFALLLLCSALFATAQEWQWSVQLKGFISSETWQRTDCLPVDTFRLPSVACRNGRKAQYE